MDLRSKEKVVQGVAWQGVARWGSQILSFVFYAGLARLLSPRIFGLVAIGWVYVALVQVFVRQGFGDAVIQRRDLEPEHLDSAFWIAMVTGSLLCLLSVLLSGPIAHIFKEPTVAPVIGWLSLFFPLAALSSIPTAVSIRELNFRPLAVASLVATGIGGATGLTMAFYGWGVWSLVGQQLLSVALSCGYLWLAVRWRPRLRISRRHLRDLYGFSLGITANDVLAFFTQKSDQTLVGYGFGSAGLGPYSLAARVSNLLHDGIVGVFQSVAFPVLSKCDPERFERALKKFCELSSFIALPVFAGVAVVAPDLVPLLFGPKWNAAIPILQILTVYSAVRVVLGFVHPTMLAKGRTGLYVAMNIGFAALTFAGCLSATRWSPEAVAIAVLAAQVLFGIFELAFVPAKVVGMRSATLLRTIAFPVFSTVFMVVVVMFLRGLVSRSFGPISTLAICVPAGAAVYILTAFKLRSDLAHDAWEMAYGVFSRAISQGRHHEAQTSIECVADTSVRS